MKCPNCNEEVPQGYLFCPKCLEEVPWVSEYNTVETLQEKHIHSKNKRIQKVKRQLKEHHMPNRRRKVLLVSILLGCFVLVSAGIAGFVFYDHAHSYAYQYDKAQQKLIQGDYDEALEYIDRAIVLEPKIGDAQVLLADILVGKEDMNGAIKTMESSIQGNPEDELLYEKLIRLYLQNDQPDKIKMLLDECHNNLIREKFAEYLTADPVITMETGSYDHFLKVEIQGDSIEYYYTLDGAPPSRKSILYEQPIDIGEGTTQLQVVGYNKWGIPSDIIYRKYIVEIQPPNPPEILPEETSFDTDTLITIRVPEGCTCYYSFDDIPTLDSPQYSEAVSMPEGTHTIYAFLVGASGKESDVASKTYELIY